MWWSFSIRLFFTDQLPMKYPGIIRPLAASTFVASHNLMWQGHETGMCDKGLGWEGLRNLSLSAQNASPAEGDQSWGEGQSNNHIFSRKQGLETTPDGQRRKIFFFFTEIEGETKLQLMSKILCIRWKSGMLGSCTARQRVPNLLGTPWRRGKALMCTHWSHPQILGLQSTSSSLTTSAYPVIPEHFLPAQLLKIALYQESLSSISGTFRRPGRDIIPPDSFPWRQWLEGLGENLYWVWQNDSRSALGQNQPLNWTASRMGFPTLCYKCWSLWRAGLQGCDLHEGQNMILFISVPIVPGRVLDM